jgi:hypothetical protein
MIADDILAKARASTGLFDIGDPSMLDGLEILAKASSEEAKLSATGAAQVGSASGRNTRESLTHH